jgi:hypothetical protein
MRGLSFLLPAVMMTVAAPAAHAQIFVDQVERLDVERGEHEWELQAVHGRAANGAPRATIVNYSAEFGVADHLALGFELETGAEGGDGLATDAFEMQAKVVALDPSEAPVGIGAQMSIGRSRDRVTEAELRLLAETRFSDFALASDISFDATLDGDESHDVGVRYAARLDWSRPWGVLGLEAGGDWGALGDMRWSSADRHWIGPVAAAALFDGIDVEAGAFAGLTDATPDVQFRLQIDVH